MPLLNRKSHTSSQMVERFGCSVKDIEEAEAHFEVFKLRYGSGEEAVKDFSIADDVSMLPIESEKVKILLALKIGLWLGVQL